MPAISEALSQFEALSPNAIALTCGEESWSAAQLRNGASGIATQLRELGVVDGDAIWLTLPSGGSFVLACMACELLGAVAVPLNPTTPVAELLSKADVIPPRAIFLAKESEGTAMDSELGAALVDLGFACEMVTETSFLQWAESQGDGLAKKFADKLMPALVLFTSGTTGAPKGVPLTHRGLKSAALSSAESLGLKSSDEIASPLPMFHVFGLVVGLLAPWFAGASVRTTRRFIPDHYLADMADHATVLIAVPAMLGGLLAAAAGAARMPKLRLVATGGAPLPAPLAESFHQIFGVLPKVGYGMTETSGVISLPREAQDSAGCGWPIETIDVDIRRSALHGMDGDTAASVGEIWVKGENVIRHYLTAGGAQVNALDRDGWFNTGDLGAITDNGELMIAGRSKELIIRGGYNVYPAEVEAVLMRHPAVKEAVVVAVAHNELGEDVAAYVVRSAGTAVDAATVIAWARNQLALYKYPRAIMFVDQLPMTPAGKVMRHKLPSFAPTP